jgi:hypothetical protein
MLRVRDLREADTEVLDACLPPEWCVVDPVGCAAERDGSVIAIGAVTWDKWGRCWAWYNSREQLPAVTMHRLAKAALNYLRKEGEPTVYAIANANVPGAARWLERLGFVRDETLAHELGPVYRCPLNK